MFLFYLFIYYDKRKLFIVYIYLLIFMITNDRGEDNFMDLEDEW